jgi:hypothetical protein
MAVIGSLAVNLVMRMNPFSKGVDDARRKLGGLRGDVAHIERTMRGFASAALGAVGVYGLGSMVSKTVTAIDELSELGSRLGIAVGALQGLQHAATLSGVSTEGLTTGLTRLNKQIGEAAAGSKPAIEAFTALGLSAERLGSMPLERALGAVADKLRAIPNVAERTRVALDIFGRGGGQMLVMLKDGSAGLKQFHDDFAKLHGTLTDEQAQRVNDFADSMGRLKVAIGGLAQKFVIDIAPAATEAINWMANELMPFIKKLHAAEAKQGTKIGKLLSPTADASAFDKHLAQWMHRIAALAASPLTGGAGIVQGEGPLASMGFRPPGGQAVTAETVLGGMRDRGMPTGLGLEIIELIRQSIRTERALWETTAALRAATPRPVVIAPAGMN